MTKRGRRVSISNLVEFAPGEFAKLDELTPAQRATCAEVTAQRERLVGEWAELVVRLAGAPIPRYVSERTIGLLEKPPTVVPPLLALRQACEEMTRWLDELEAAE